jgi:hypothetical protein
MSKRVNQHSAAPAPKLVLKARTKADDVLGPDNHMQMRGRKVRCRYTINDQEMKELMSPRSGKDPASPRAVQSPRHDVRNVKGKFAKVSESDSRRNSPDSPRKSVGLLDKNRRGSMDSLGRFSVGSIESLLAPTHEAIILEPYPAGGYVMRGCIPDRTRPITARVVVKWCEPYPVGFSAENCCMSYGWSDPCRGWIEVDMDESGTPASKPTSVNSFGNAASLKFRIIPAAAGTPYAKPMDGESETVVGQNAQLRNANKQATKVAERLRVNPSTNDLTRAPDAIADMFLSVGLDTDVAKLWERMDDMLLVQFASRWRGWEKTSDKSLRTRAGRKKLQKVVEQRPRCKSPVGGFANSSMELEPKRLTSASTPWENWETTQLNKSVKEQQSEMKSIPGMDAANINWKAVANAIASAEPSQDDDNDHVNNPQALQTRNRSAEECQKQWNAVGALNGDSATKKRASDGTESAKKKRRGGSEAQ